MCAQPQNRCVNRYEPDASTKTRKDKRNEIIIVVSPAVTSDGTATEIMGTMVTASPMRFIRGYLTRLVPWNRILLSITCILSITLSFSCLAFSFSLFRSIFSISDKHTRIADASWYVWLYIYIYTHTYVRIRCFSIHLLTISWKEPHCRSAV